MDTILECQCDASDCKAAPHAGKAKCSKTTPAFALDVNSTEGWFKKADGTAVCPACGKEHGLTEPYPPGVLS